MILTKDWIYLDLQKTGSTFLRGKLLKIFPQIPDSPEFSGKHRVCGEFHNGLRLMTIRDPFDYYYSLWSYGIDGRGGFYKSMRREFSQNEIVEMYGERSSSCFQKFLTRAMPEGKLDLYTMRVLRMLLPKTKAKLFKRILSKEIILSPEFCQDKLSKYYPSVLLPTDTLSECFHLMADSGRLRQMNLPNGWKNIFPLLSSKVNTSVYGSDLEMKRFIRKQCTGSVDLIYSNCFLPDSLYRLSKVA